MSGLVESPKGSKEALGAPSLRRLHTMPPPEVSGFPLFSMGSKTQQQQQKQHPLERGASMGPPKPKRRLVSRAELLRHSSCTLLKMLSSSSLLGGPQDASDEGPQPTQPEGVLLLYITVGWEQPCLHHRVAGGVWTSAPGDRMIKADPRTPQGKSLMGLLPQWLRGFED
ncbi:hypothetical protein Esti_005273 [Eimeria stiedai]